MHRRFHPGRRVSRPMVVVVVMVVVVDVVLLLCCLGVMVVILAVVVGSGFRCCSFVSLKWFQL